MTKSNSNASERGSDGAPEQQAIFQSLLEDSRDTVYRLNIQTGRFEYISPSVELLLGYSREELMAQDFIVSLETIHPDDRAALAAAMASLEKAGKAEVVYRQLTRSGEYRWLSNSMSLTKDGRGRPLYRNGSIRDITEDKRAEAALRESEERFKAVMANLSSGVALIDEEGKFALYNPAFLRMFGLPEDSSIYNVNDQNWADWQVFGEDGRLLPLDEHPAKKAAITGQAVRNQLVGVKLPSGEDLTWMFVTAEPAPMPGGRQGMICTYHDVTAHKLAEESLKSNEARYKVLAETMLDGVVHQDAAGNVISMNPAAERILGRTREEFVGTSSLKEEHHTIYEDGARFPGREHPAMKALSSGTHIRGVIMGVYNPSLGEYRWISVDAVPVFAAGKDRPVEVYTVFEDITDRKRAENAMRESEKQYHSLFSSMTEGFAIHEIITDEDDRPVDYRFLDINPAFERLTGLRREDVMGKTRSEVLPEDDPVWLERYGRVAMTGEPAQFDNYSPALRRHYEVFAYSIKHRQFAVIFMDVSERKRVEEELQRLAAEREQILESERAARMGAEKASRVKDDFLATISHELRTPLNAVLGWSTLLKKRPHDLDKGLSVIERNAKAQAQLIEDLLDMNRIYSGRFDIAREEVSLTQVIGDAVETIETAAREKGISVRIDLEPLTKTLVGDGARLRQVFWNLLSNAVKFTTEGGTILLSLRQRERWAEVSIADNGEGIESNFLPHIFDRFSQGEISMSKRKGGLGLGLAISKAIVELHGGSIEAASEGRGLGATFKLRFPLQELQNSVFGSPSEKLIASLPAGISIMVIEDEEDSLEFMKRLLEENGALVEPASSAVVALQILERTLPDIIVSDISMPGMDGYTFLRSVRALADERSRIPAIAVTAFTRKEDEEKAYEAGFTAHLPKPVNPADLLRIISVLLKDES